MGARSAPSPRAGTSTAPVASPSTAPISGSPMTTATVWTSSSGAACPGTPAGTLQSKEDVADMTDASSRPMELRPVTFHYKAQPDGPLQYGLIAEEVEQVMPELVVR